MLLGEFHHNIDEKGRLVIPTKFREEMKESFILAKGIDKHLSLYAKDEWDKLVSKLNTLPFTKKDARSFNRFFFSGATVCEFDKSGRISITSPLVSYAGLEKECVIIGVNDHIEIWSKDFYNNFMNENDEIIDEIAEHLFEGDNYAL